MHPHRARLVACFALLLLLQAMVAPSLCLARMAPQPGHSIEICGPDGLRTVTLPGDEAPASTNHAGDSCLACQALPQALMAAPAVLSTPAWFGMVQSHAPTAPEGLRPAIRGPPLGAQAPPQLS